MMQRQNYLWIAAVLLTVISATAVQGATFANSFDDWSTTGTQGENGWFNGYYNLTLDQLEGDGEYQTNDFIPFLNDGSLEVLDDNENQWDGNAWRLYRDTVADGFAAETGPWTRIEQLTGHPNGTNSTPPSGDDDQLQEEHWAIRRWVSNYEGSAYLLTDVTPPATCSTGTTLDLYLNGVLQYSILATGTDPVFDWVQSTLKEGDILDVALTPVGLGGNRGDGCDATGFELTITDERPPDKPDPPILPLADSVNDWSGTGTQGEKNWFNGYYNFTLDGDGDYAAEDFIPFTNTAGPGGGPVQPDGNHWTGGQWDLNSEASGPWTELGIQNTHPNGTNSAPGEEHWTIRRWVAAELTGTTPLKLTWQTAKANTGGGNGVTGAVYVNGTLMDSATIGGTDGTGVTRDVFINAQPDDVIDLILSPVGIGGTDDGADGSTNRLSVTTDIGEGPWLNPGELLADSATEFSENQGQDNWFFGYYDQLTDALEGDAQYGVEDFIPFLNDGSNFVSDDPEIGGWKESENHWDGSKWDLLNQGFPDTEHGPWTEMTATGGHPAANAQDDPEVHWFIRRWVSEHEGVVNISGSLFAAATCGDGTVGRILVDGEEVWSAVSAGTTELADLNLNLSEGSVVDIAVDPDGASVFDPADPENTILLVNDGCDATTFTVRMQSLLPFIPEGGIRGDFNGNGEIDLGDIDILTEQSAAETHLAQYDLTGDGLVDVDDVTEWAKADDIGYTWIGDANFDGKFDTGDFVQVLGIGKYELAGATAVWSEGDWNGDGVFGTGDLVAALSDGGYELGPRTDVAAVPEPSAIVLSLLGLAGLVGLSRRRQG